MVSQLNRGSRTKSDAALSAAVYEAVLAELGATGTIIPLGDPIYRTGSTTWRSHAGVSGLETAVWTASEAPENFDTPPTRQGICPVISFNGTDEEFTTPTNAYWNQGNATADSAFSITGWVNMTSAQAQYMLARRSANNPGAEWEFVITGGDINMRLIDNTTSHSEKRVQDTAMSDNAWHHVAMTYDASESSDGIILYMDGVLVASSTADVGTYAAMHANTGLTSIGGRGDSSTYGAGKIAGGCAGVCFVEATLTAEQVMNIYRLQKGALAL